jgi:DNA-binding transcriptional ArsR family regulator
MARHDPYQALLDALRHPLRRNLLRRYVESKETLSPSELARLERKPLSSVSYHVRVLADRGALEIVREAPVRGSVAHFYKATPLAREARWVMTTLGLEG